MSATCCLSLKFQTFQLKPAPTYYNRIETTAAPWVTVLDITNKIFGGHLFNAPITAVGENCQVHFCLPSLSSRVRLGRNLAPIEHWGQFGQEMDTDDVELTGGLQSLSMTQKSLVGGVQMETNLTIKPSVRIKDNTGVYMHVNSHHLLTDLPADHGSEQAMTLLMEQFEPATEEADTIIETTMRLDA